MGYDLGNVFSGRGILKRFASQYLVNLGDMEGDYRNFQLKDDIRQSILFMFIAIISVLSMLRMDFLLFKDQPDLFTLLLVYRFAFVFVTSFIIAAIRKANKVRIFDRLVLGWISFTVFYLLLFNFTRPANSLTTALGIIVPFAIYVLSPLKMFYNIALAIGYSAGIMYVDHFLKVGVDTSAQLVVHALGLLSGLQIQTYRRKSFRAYVQEKDAKEMVAYLANIDPLTKSLTRRQFFNIAESEFLRFLRYHRELSILVLDADYFKNINDTYGHHAGDLVLRSLALAVLEQKRAQDTLGRLGGEEFGLLLPETNLEQAKIVAERIQKIWEQTPCKMDGELIHSTVSIGVAQATSEDKSFDDILRRGDRMMYKAKEAGRNQVVTK
jgi:diguanylate cyclase (GGDEF)-like protein